MADFRKVFAGCEERTEGWCFPSVSFVFFGCEEKKGEGERREFRVEMSSSDMDSFARSMGFSDLDKRSELAHVIWSFLEASEVLVTDVLDRNGWESFGAFSPVSSEESWLRLDFRRIADLVKDKCPPHQEIGISMSSRSLGSVSCSLEDAAGLFASNMGDVLRPPSRRKNEWASGGVLSLMDEKWNAVSEGRDVVFYHFMLTKDDVRKMNRRMPWTRCFHPSVMSSLLKDSNPFCTIAGGGRGYSFNPFLRDDSMRDTLFPVLHYTLRDGTSEKDVMRVIRKLFGTPPLMKKEMFTEEPGQRLWKSERPTDMGKEWFMAYPAVEESQKLLKAKRIGGTIRHSAM